MKHDVQYTPPDGEIYQSPFAPPAPEFAALPPEFPSPGYDAPASEIAAPPPEYPKGLTTKEAETQAKKRKWKKLAAAVLAGVVGIGTLFGAKGQTTPKAPSGDETYAPDTAAVSDDAPTIEFGYALTDGETVYYSYFVRVPETEPPEAESPCWPVTVRPRLSASDGQSADGAEDVWEFARVSQFSYELPVPDGMSGAMTLTLTGAYETDGETRAVTAAKAVEPMPEGSAGAYLWINDDGTADFKAYLIAQEGDAHPYDLEPIMLWAEALDENGQRLTGFWSLGDMSELQYDRFDEETFSEYTFYRCDKIDEAPDGAKYCQFRMYLRDNSNGYIYQIDSNICPLPAKRYPLGDEQIQIVVYNDTLTFDFPSPAGDFGEVTILLYETVNAADFTDMELPLPLVPSDYRSLGYVVHVGNPLDNGNWDALDTIFATYDGDPPVSALVDESSFAFKLDGYTLTRDVVEKVPISEDGVRYVNIHAAWAPWDDGHFLVQLDDGQGNVTDFPVGSPIYSEGFLYACTFPQPVPPIGCYFDGWYTENGERVELLMDYFSFTPERYDADGNFLGYDWSVKNTLKLIAHWNSYN